jgi:hypothetical protein
MRRTLGPAIAAVIALASIVSSASAQDKKATGGFTAGYTDIGPLIGLGGIGSASASFGGRFEHAIKALPSMNNGILGIEAGFDYYSWSALNYSWKYIPIGVTANYHFKLDDSKIDPFLGAGLGYQLITCDYKGSGLGACSNSAIYFIGRAGARYFLSQGMSVYADVGAGAATFNVGMMFKLH